MTKKGYRLVDIEKVLENISYSNPGLERITINQLEKTVKITKTPAIYNIKEIILNLEAYIRKFEKLHDFMFCSEKEVCKIVGVKNLLSTNGEKRFD